MNGIDPAANPSSKIGSTNSKNRAETMSDKPRRRTTHSLYANEGGGIRTWQEVLPGDPDFDELIAAAREAVRIHDNPDSWIIPYVDTLVAKLKEMGHKVVVKSYMGAVQIVKYAFGENIYYGSSDLRKEGVAIGY